MYSFLIVAFSGIDLTLLAQASCLNLILFMNLVDFSITLLVTVKLGITLPKSIIHTIDQRRGDIPRSRYIRRAVERYLGSSKDIDHIDNKAAAATKERSSVAN